MKLTGPQLASTYKTHLYTREHLRSNQLNNLMDSIEITMGSLGIDWDKFPTPDQWDNIATALNIPK